MPPVLSKVPAPAVSAAGTIYFLDLPIAATAPAYAAMSAAYTKSSSWKSQFIHLAQIYSVATAPASFAVPVVATMVKLSLQSVQFIDLHLERFSS